MKHTGKEPFLRMKKRDNISRGKALGIRLLAIVLALVVCSFVIIAVTGQNPLQVYAGIIDGAVGSSRRIWVTIRETAILLLVAVGLTPAFKMKFWNIGAEGQILMGGAASAALMIYLGDKVPNAILLILILLGSALAGLLWGLIPAIFKAKYNTNETLVTLMLNYVAMQFITFLIVFWENPSGSNTVGIINAGSKAGWFPKMFGTDYFLNIVIVTVMTLGVYLYMKYSKQGYEISVVGESQETARYAGMNVKKVVLRTMFLSGAVCGIGGMVQATGSDVTLTTAVAGGVGFTAIIVAWLAQLNPPVILLVTFLFSVLEKGSSVVQSSFGLSSDCADVLQGIILFFILGCELFIRYQFVFRGKGGTRA